MIGQKKYHKNWASFGQSILRIKHKQSPPIMRFCNRWEARYVDPTFIPHPPIHIVYHSATYAAGNCPTRFFWAASSISFHLSFSYRNSVVMRQPPLGDGTTIPKPVETRIVVVCPGCPIAEGDRSVFVGCTTQDAPPRPGHAWAAPGTHISVSRAGK